MNNQIEPMPKRSYCIRTFLLYIKFKNGEEKIYDMKEKCLSLIIIKFKGNREIFKTVKTFGVNTCMEKQVRILHQKRYFDSIPISEYKFEIKRMNNKNRALLNYSCSIFVCFNKIL